MMGLEFIDTIMDFSFGMPDDDQLLKMNRYRPKGAKPYAKEEMMTCSFIASDNLLSYSNAVWGVNELDTMAKYYCGKPMLPDHDDMRVLGTMGFIYDAVVVKTDIYIPIDADNPRELIKEEKDIVKRDGHIRLMLSAAFPASSIICDLIRYRQVSDVSTGVFTKGISRCPLDGTLFNEYAVCEKGHIMPHPYILMFADLDEEEKKKLAPYYIREGVVDVQELSFVVDGNLPDASIPIAGNESDSQLQSLTLSTDGGL